MSHAIFHCLDQLQQILFSIYIKRDYPTNQDFYERKIERECLHFFSLILKNPSARIDHLFEIIIALGSLRYRVNDFSTFEVCEKELSVLSALISQIFLHECCHSDEGFLQPRISRVWKILRGVCSVGDQDDSQRSKNKEKMLEEFSQVIEAFSDVYRSALQVVAEDPLVFLIFIENLWQLHQEVAA